MRFLKTTFAVLCSTALLTAATAEPVSAQNFNRTTKLTFSAPVELPNMTLPAGTSTFRLSDSKSDRHVVQVLDADGEKLVTTLLAMPAHRSEASEETVVTFRETAANVAPPIRYWYYPNDQMGQEFAYPRARAEQIALATGESVLAIDGEEITRVESTPAVVTPVPMTSAPETPAPVEPAPVIVPAPAPVQPVTPTVQPQPEPQPMAPEPQPVATSGSLPDTASPLPLVGLVGLLALGGAMLIRTFRRSAA